MHDSECIVTFAVYLKPLRRFSNTLYQDADGKLLIFRCIYCNHWVFSQQERFLLENYDRAVWNTRCIVFSERANFERSATLIVGIQWLSEINTSYFIPCLLYTVSQNYFSVVYGQLFYCTFHITCNLVSFPS